MAKEILDSLVRQAVPILISAAVAGGLAFLQSLAASGGLCPAPVVSPEVVGLMGGMVKAGHTLAIGLIRAA